MNCDDRRLAGVRGELVMDLSMPILQDLGIDATPSVFEVYNIIDGK